MITVICLLDVKTLPRLMLGEWALCDTSPGNVISSTAVTRLVAGSLRSRIATRILRTWAPTIQAHLATQYNPVVLYGLGALVWSGVLAGLISQECGTVIWEILCGTVSSMPRAADALATSIEELA